MAVTEERGAEAAEGCLVCLFCGKLAPAGDKFCNSCGNNLLAPAVAGRAGAVPPREFRGIPPACFPARRAPVVGYPMPRFPAGARPPYGAPQAGYPDPPPPPAAPAQAGSQPVPAFPDAAGSGRNPPAPPIITGTSSYRTPGRERKKAEDLAAASVICGIAGFTLLPVIAAAAAVVTGCMALARLRSGPRPVEGEGLAAAGVILGAAGLAAAVVTLILMLAL